MHALDIRDVFFSFDGRASRRLYWLGPIVFFVGIASLLVASTKLGGTGGGVLTLALFVAFLILGTWASLAIAVKRLHDRDKSGHWLWLFYVLPAILNYEAAAMGDRTPFGIMLFVVSSVLSLWGFVEMGFLRGTPGGNLYGEDPRGY